MGFAINIAAFLAAYLTGIIVYMLLVWIITREGRGMLMHGDRMNVVFYSQLSATWAFAAIAAATVAIRMVRNADLGLVIASTAAVGLAFVVLRNYTKARHEQSFLVSLLLICCIAAGTAAVCVLAPGTTP